MAFSKSRVLIQCQESVKWSNSLKILPHHRTKPNLFKNVSNIKSVASQIKLFHAVFSCTLSLHVSILDTSSIDKVIKLMIVTRRDGIKRLKKLKRRVIVKITTKCFSVVEKEGSFRRSCCAYETAFGVSSMEGFKLK